MKKHTTPRSQPRIHCVDQFYSDSDVLRRHFESRFKNPHEANADRFVWDYWHVPDQYTVLRTPAYHFFPPKIYHGFHEQLVKWGRENLGCHDVSPPWLSLYIDGCRQEFHADLPHGPWAFVYSLTPWKGRKFTGGETVLVKDSMLRFWENMDLFRGLEQEDILQFIEPKFDRLTVFDPRVPHGVRRVEGVFEPREGRLVIHGWFVQPRPFLEGPLSRRSFQKMIDSLLEGMGSRLPAIDLMGILSVRFKVSATGRIGEVQFLSNTLISGHGPQGKDVSDLLEFLSDFLREYRFPAASGASWITLPLTFEA